MAMSKEIAIGRMKAWALKNYDKGADTFVECYDDAEWEELWNAGGQRYLKCMKLMRRIASVLADRQADARYYRDHA